MKKHILLLLLIIPSLILNAQVIQNVTVLPANPTEDDQVQLVIENVFPSGGCDLQMEQHNNFLSYIQVDLYHCLGPLTFICTSFDTITLGHLAAGNYPIFINLFSDAGFPACTMYTFGDSVRRDISVAFGTGIDNTSLIHPLITQRQRELLVTNIPSGSMLSLYDLVGRKVLSEKLYGDTSIPFYEAEGIYLYQLSTPAGETLSGKFSSINR